VALVILDHELACAPRGLVHSAQQPRTSRCQRFSGGLDIVRLEIEIEMPALANELDRWIGVVDELEMNDLAAEPDAGVEVLRTLLTPARAPAP
jgi:hypothetical protein